MMTTNVHLMSRPTDSPHPGGAATGTARTWLTALEDAASFALVGVAAVGFVVESLDVPTDNARGVLEVAAGASVGALGSAIYRRLETRSERLARFRVMAWNIVRFFVAFELIRYGVAKLVGMQFYPRYYRLDMRAADLSPMALAWAFLGRTYGYQAAIGALEITAALLLCFRRTAILGACILVPVMTNVVFMDVFYDVPVKLFSSIYLVMALYVLLPDARRFWIFFLGDGAVPARAPLAFTTPSQLKRIVTVFTIALIIVLPSADIVHKAFQRGIFRTDALEGAWRVERRAGLDGLPVAKGTWEMVYFEKGGYGFVRVDGQRVPFKTDITERAKTLRLFEIGDSALGVGSSARELGATYTLQGRRLRVEGVYAGVPFSIDLERELPR
jgi:hypothetical protein